MLCRRVAVVAVLVLIQCSLLTLLAQNEAWQELRIPDVCTFKLPPTMELQGGAYKDYMNSVHRELNVPASASRVVVQPKGINQRPRRHGALLSRHSRN
jgi:hypothetical protein